MKPVPFVDFLRAIGHRVVSTETTAWFDASPWFFLSAPSHRECLPSEEEIRSVLGNFPCAGLRYAAPPGSVGKPSYQIVCDDPGFGLESLSANVRSKVRRGLKRCRVEPISFDRLAELGGRLHEDTLSRQARSGKYDPDRWRTYCSAAARTPGMEAWAAWHDEALAAFLVSVSFEESVEFLLARSSTEHLGAYPNNALLFTITEEMMVRRKIPEITFGLESLEPVGPLDQFKFGMGFRQRELCQRVVFHPVLRTLLQPSSVRNALRAWSNRHGEEKVFWRKAAGLLAFAEQGGW